MTNKLKKARASLIKAAEELDGISRCYYAKKKSMTAIARVLLKQFYRY